MIILSLKIKNKVKKFKKNYRINKINHKNLLNNHLKINQCSNMKWSLQIKMTVNKKRKIFLITKILLMLVKMIIIINHLALSRMIILNKNLLYPKKFHKNKNNP